MPILKTEILGSQIEINYENDEYDRLINLVNHFKNRLAQFPNNGRVGVNSIIFLAALKAEDELEGIKNEININYNKKKLDEKNSIIDELNKEIILLRKELDKTRSSNISNTKDKSSTIDEIDKLEKITKLIQEKIKETIK